MALILFNKNKQIWDLRLLLIYESEMLRASSDKLFPYPLSHDEICDSRP